jgi:hypothetical protein
MAVINWAISKALNGILQAAAWIVGLFDKDAADWIRSHETKVGSLSDAWDNAVAKFNDMPDYDTLTDKADKFGDSLDKAADALNEVTGYRLASATYDTMDTRGMKPHATGGRVVGINSLGEAITVQDGEGIASVGVGERIVPAGGNSGAMLDRRTFVSFGQVQIVAKDGDERKLWNRLVKYATVDNIGAGGSPFNTGLPIVGVAS